MRNRKKAALLSKECVACGCCAKSCPLGAISIYRGLHALVDGNICAGCGKCEIVCPAQIISVVLGEAAAC
jgi:MinD superfamily P-loop ATPase